MIIDFHAHTFPDKIAAAAVASLAACSHLKPHTDATNSGLAASMKRSGIDRSVILPVATSPRQVRKVNDSSARVNEGSAEHGLISFGCMHPDFEDWHDELSRIRSLGLKGIKLHPPYQGADLDDIRYLRIISRAAELGLIVLTHAGWDIGLPEEVRCTPAMCRHVMEETGPFPFVLAHMGGWREWEEVPGLLAGTGVYLDTAFSVGECEPGEDGYWDGKDRSMLQEEDFLKLVKAFGADHVLFGTDSPWSDQKKSLEWIRNLPLAGADKEKILGENAARLLKI